MAIAQEVIDSIRQAAIDSSIEGIQSTSVDGTTVAASNPMIGLDVADRLESRNSGSGTAWGIRTKILIPPGGGGP